MQPELKDQAERWLTQDPDPQTRDELQKLIDSNDDELTDCFAGRLQFGTAGLRGKLGPGPNRMNRVVVMQAAAGLAAYLNKHHPHEASIVIGYDARHNSDVFARDTAAIMQGAGINALVLPKPLPTPVLAYAIKHLGASAGVMVTASHNPPQDNGYKVYLADGCQIIPPADADIAAEIERIANTTHVQDLPTNSEWVTLGDDVLEDYLTRAEALVTDEQRQNNKRLTAVITPMHGVGGETLHEVLTRTGFPEPIHVAEQFEPNPNFPTVAFPNPEEPGAMDLALETAANQQPDIVIANDPDADRCAIAISTNDGYRMLTGDEVGSLLGWWATQQSNGSNTERTALAQSIVSGTMLKSIAESAGLTYEHTLTGFKWIGRIPGLRFGYEEALGYCVDPEGVSDKDGITAALAVSTLAAHLKASNQTLQDKLDVLAREHGVHATKQVSVRVTDLNRITEVMSTLRTQPPTDIGGLTVERFVDLELGAELPPTDGLLFELDGNARVIIRPSGTEPKVKAYLQAVVPVTADLASAREQAAQQITALEATVRTWLN
jgi:phosphomannomutase